MVSLLHDNSMPLAKNKFLSDVCVLISWYKRSELGSRIAVIISAATIAGAFSVYITLGYGKLIDYRDGQVVSSLQLSMIWTASVESLGGPGFSS
jgi:hypothetical protein